MQQLAAKMKQSSASFSHAAHLLHFSVLLGIVADLSLSLMAFSVYNLRRKTEVGALRQQDGSITGTTLIR